MRSPLSLEGPDGKVRFLERVCAHKLRDVLDECVPPPCYAFSHWFSSARIPGHSRSEWRCRTVPCGSFPPSLVSVRLASPSSS